MRKTRFWQWLALAVAVALACFSILVVLGAVINVFSAQHGGVGLGTSVITAVVIIVVLIACVRWSVHVEHRLRARGPGAGTGRAAAGQRHPTPGGYRPRVYHHRQGPVAATVAAVIFTLVGLGMAFGAVVAFGSWRLSAYVQSHGEPVPAIVLSVRNIQHSSRSGYWYTADVRAVLRRPVGGTDTTTAYDPSGTSMLPGAPVTVLVDPQRPGYAELPGRPYATAGTWIALNVGSVLMLLFAVLLWRELAIRIRQRRNAAGLAFPAPTSP